MRATGVDDLLDFINPSSSSPASASRSRRPPTTTTCRSRSDRLHPRAGHELRPRRDHGAATPAAPLDIFFGEYLERLRPGELFQPAYGFGEPLVDGTLPGRAPPNLCNFIAYGGVRRRRRVSYGYVHDSPGLGSFTTSGVHVPLLGAEVLLALIGAASTAVRSPGRSATRATASRSTRYFVVGDGTVSSIIDARNEIQCLPTGTLQGTVTAGRRPGARAPTSPCSAAPPTRRAGRSTRNVLTSRRHRRDGQLLS